MPDIMYGWHRILPDFKLGYRDDRVVEVGKWYKFKRNPALQSTRKESSISYVEGKKIWLKEHGKPLTEELALVLRKEAKDEHQR